MRADIEEPLVTSIIENSPCNKFERIRIVKALLYFANNLDEHRDLMRRYDTRCFEHYDTNTKLNFLKRMHLSDWKGSVYVATMKCFVLNWVFQEIESTIFTKEDNDLINHFDDQTASYYRLDSNEFVLSDNIHNQDEWRTNDIIKSGTRYFKVVAKVLKPDWSPIEAPFSNCQSFVCKYFKVSSDGDGLHMNIVFKDTSEEEKDAWLQIFSIIMRSDDLYDHNSITPLYAFYNIYKFMTGCTNTNDAIDEQFDNIDQLRNERLLYNLDFGNPLKFDMTRQIIHLSLNKTGLQYPNPFYSISMHDSPQNFVNIPQDHARSIFKLIGENTHPLYETFENIGIDYVDYFKISATRMPSLERLDRLTLDN